MSIGQFEEEERRQAGDKKNQSQLVHDDLQLKRYVLANYRSYVSNFIEILTVETRTKLSG